MARTILRAGKILVVMIFMTASLLLMLLSLWSPAQTGTAPPGDEETVDSSLIADVPLEEEPNALWEERYELVGQRDQNHRTWQVIRGLEAIDPVTNEATVEEVISKVVEVGDGICYQDPNGTWQVTHPRWVEVGGGFTMYTAGYKLDIGRRLGSGLRYELNGESVFLSPSHIVAYDGAYLGDIARLDPQAVGVIDPNDGSRLVFADGFGRGIDVVFSVSSGGYHQDIIFHEAVRLGAEFDPENTYVFVYTELNAEPAQVDGTIDIVMEGGASQSFSELSETPPTQRRLTLTKRVDIDGHVYQYDLCRFGESVVFGGLPAGARQEAIADKQLVREGEITFLVESLNHTFFRQAVYPVVWDYEQDVSGGLSANETWYANTTYNVTDNLTIEEDATLRIEPGTRVKLYSGKKISAASEGRLIARGKPHMPIVFEPYSGSFYGIEIGEGSEIEFCRIRNASAAIRVSGIPGIPIRHNQLSYCLGSGIEVFGDAIGTDTPLWIFNNLILGDPCDAPPNDPCGLPAGIKITADPSDVCNIHIYNNTLWGMSRGIQLSPYIAGTISVKDNIFAKCDYGIYAPYGFSAAVLGNDYNGYYANTTNVGGGASGVGTGANAATATEDPFYTYWLHSYYSYLNTNANGGAKFINQGSRTAISAYGDPYDWAIHSPVQSSGHGYTTNSTISSDTIWQPNAEVCDTGAVDMGYHHPRVDYCIAADVTVDGGSGVSVTLTIKPGTVIAHYVNPSTGAGRLETDGDTGDESEDGTADGLICLGDPFGAGHIKWVESSRAFPATYTTTPYSNTKPFVIMEEGSDYDVRFTQFEGLGWVLQVEEGGGTLRDNRFFLNTRPVYAVGCEGLEIANCLFACNNLAVLDYEGAGGLLVEGGTFDRNSRSINIAGSTSTSATIRNCLFTEYDFGIRKNNLNATITENHNAFRSTISGKRDYCEYDPPDFTDLDLDGTDQIPEVDPYDSNWLVFEDRFHLAQDCNAVDTGYDPDQIGMVGYTTRLDMEVDDPNRDIGYHYPLDKDTDRDMLPDYEEYWYGTPHDSRDADGDGLTDYQEAVLYGTDPNSLDSDGDTIPDWWEIKYAGADATVADPNADPENGGTGDGLTNLQEYQWSLDPDTDNDADSWTDFLYADNGKDPNELRYEVQEGTVALLAATLNYSDALGRIYLQRRMLEPGDYASDPNFDEVVITLYDRNGAVTKSIRKGPQSFTLAEDPNNDLITVFGYDTLGRVMLRNQLDPNELTVYHYDDAGNTTRIVQLGDRITDTEYDPAGRATKVTDAEGHYREMTYDSRGHVVKQVLKNASHTAIQQDRWYYNNVGDLTRQVTMADPDATGDPSTSTDRVIDYAYSYTSAARTRFTYTYDGTSTFTAYSITSSEDKSGRGLPTQIMQGQASGHARVLEKRYYDRAGRVTKTIRENRDAADTAQVTVTTLMTYDAHGRMQYSIADGGQGNTLTTVYAYDGDDRQVWVRNPKGYWTYSGYDALGRLTQKIEDVDETYGINRVTDYQYDRLGRLVTLIAENSSTGNQTTVYTYDLGDRVVDIKYPDGDSVAYAYGTIGTVTQRIDQASVTTSYTYDKLGRLTQKYRLGQSGTDIREVYAYDARGLMTTAKKGDASPYTSISSDTLSYNALGALTQSAQSVFGTSKTITYSRDTLGQAARITYPDAGSTQMNFTYTSLGQVNQVSKASDLIVDYAYYGSIVYTRDYDNADVTQTATYDSFGRISTLNTVNSSNAGVRFAYTYDDNGNILSKRFNHRSGTPSNIYSYDRLDRLTQARYLVGVLTEDEEFEYDPLGNRVSMEDRGDNTIAYAANTVNEYTAIGGVSVAYDACGNLSKDAAGYSYAYDHDNRLVCVYTDANADGDYDAGTDTGHGLYDYDALGRRIRKVLGGVTTKYYYDGQRVILETDNAATTDRRMFAYGNYIDEVLVMEKLAGDNQGMYYYGHDHLFSVCILFEAAGAVAERYEYDAYGSVHILSSDFCILSSSQYSNPYTFTGRRLDLLDAGALPLMYYRARTYDPTIGRFLQRDRLGYMGGMSLYGYVGNCPVVGLDPFGLLDSVRLGICKMVAQGMTPEEIAFILGLSVEAVRRGLGTTCPAPPPIQLPRIRRPPLRRTPEPSPQPTPEPSPPGPGPGPILPLPVVPCEDCRVPEPGPDPGPSPRPQPSPSPTPLPDPAPVPIPRPGEGMQPPGDCEWPRYWVLRNAYKNACKGKLRCKKGQNPKVWPEIKDRLDRCIKAREDLNNECFRGGDQKHYDWIENNLKPWRDECLDLMRQCTPRRR